MPETPSLALKADPPASAIAPSMANFILIWIGQVFSLVGSRMTNFALSVWVYQHTNSTAQFTFLILATTLPTILISPIAGVFVDR